MEGLKKSKSTWLTDPPRPRPTVSTLLDLQRQNNQAHEVGDFPKTERAPRRKLNFIPWSQLPSQTHSTQHMTPCLYNLILSQWGGGLSFTCSVLSVTLLVNKPRLWTHCSSLCLLPPCHPNKIKTSNTWGEDKCKTLKIHLKLRGQQPETILYTTDCYIKI